MDALDVDSLLSVGSGKIEGISVRAKAYHIVVRDGRWQHDPKGLRIKQPLVSLSFLLRYILCPSAPSLACSCCNMLHA